MCRCLRLNQSQLRQIKIEMSFFFFLNVIFPGSSAVLELKITRFRRRKKLLSFTTDLQHADMGKCIIAANAPISVLADTGRHSSDWLANRVACGKLAAPVPRLRPKCRKRGSLGGEMAWKMLCGGQVFLRKINTAWAVYFLYAREKMEREREEKRERKAEEKVVYLYCDKMGLF